MNEDDTVVAVSLIERFNEAFTVRDIEAVMTLMTPDCVFEGTQPPDGHRYTGQDGVRAAFQAVFDSARGGSFSTEELFCAGDRVVARWRFDWVDHQGRPGHVRGVDLFRIRGGLVAEKLSYVKG